MADNKRPKEDYTSALKKQVGKVVPAKQAKSQESVSYFNEDGKEVVLYRDRMTDAEWDIIKKKVMADQQAAAAKSARETQQNERDRAWQALNNPKSQFAPELGIDEKTRNALLQMDPDKAIDFVLARSRNAGRQRDLAKKSEEPKPVAQEKPVAAPAPKRSGGTGTQTEDTLTVGSAEPGMSVRGNMARLMLGAAPGPEDAAAGINKTVNEAVDAAQLPSTPDAGVSGKFDVGPVEMTDAGVLSSEGSNPALNQAAQAQANTRFYGQGGVVDPTMEDMPLSTRGKLMEAMEPVTNFAQGLGNAAAAGVNAINAIPDKFGRAVANTLLPDGTPAVADADPMDAPPSFTMPGQAPTRGGQVVPPGTGIPVADAPTPGTTSGGVSMGGAVKTTKPGQSAAPAPVNPNIAAIQQATDTALAAGAASAEIESKALQDKADLMAKQERDILDAEKRAAEIQTIKAERMRKAEVGLASLQSRLAELEQQSIDPNRFWNNKSDGQKAMAVVAGALFGFTGQGMQWLQRLDSLVEQDIQTQFADFKRKEATLGKQVDIQNNIIALARQQGLDDTEALNAARASMKERYALQLENIAATSGSQLVQQKALQNAAEIRMGAAKDIEEMRLKAKTAAADNAYKWALTRKALQETAESRFNMGLKAAGGGKSGNAPDLKPAEKEAMAEIQTWAEEYKRMVNDYRKARSAAGFLPGEATAMTGAVMEKVPFKGSVAARWKDNVVRKAQILGKPLEGGVVREEDSKRYEQSYIPSLSETTEAADAKIRDLGLYAINKYKAMYEQHRVAGTEGFERMKTPEQFASEVMSAMGGSGGGVQFTPAGS